ncbi:uncharacterized protein ACR2FA_009622, partial [Aphomia sociella]
LSDISYRLVRNLAYPEDLEVLSFKKLVELLDSHFKPKHCTFADKAKFYAATRNPGETLGDWAARLRGLASQCDFGAALDTNLTDRFVIGLGSGPERDKLFEQNASKLSLSRALEIAEQAESAREAKSSIYRDLDVGIKEEAVYKVTCRGASKKYDYGCSKHRSGNGRMGYSKTSRVYSENNENIPCSVCGMKNHDKDRCRYKNYKCLKCGEKGHLKKVCGKQKKVAAYA